MIFGVVTICIYAVYGVISMNDWAVTAASGLPLDTTIAEMNRAGQYYSTSGGIIFAALGILLALAWGYLVSSQRLKIRPWAAVATWGAIIMLGAPAYYSSSFANLNNVGDTFYDWNSEAAFAVEMPLYIVSGLALVLAGGALLLGLLRPRPR